MLSEAAGRLMTLAQGLDKPDPGLSPDVRERIMALPGRTVALGQKCTGAADEVAALATQGAQVLASVRSRLEAGSEPAQVRPEVDLLIVRITPLRDGAGATVRSAQELREVVADLSRRLARETGDLTAKVDALERDRAAAQSRYNEIAARVDTMRILSAILPVVGLVNELVSLIESGKLTLQRLQEASEAVHARRRSLTEAQAALDRSGAIANQLDDILSIVQNLANTLTMLQSTLEQDQAWLEIGTDRAKAKVYIAALQKSLDWLRAQVA